MSKTRRGDKIKVFFVCKKGDIEKGIIRAIKKDAGGNPIIEFIHSHRVFVSRNALATLVMQNKNLGKVYMLNTEMPIGAIETADQTGVAIGVIFKEKSGGWEILHTAEEVIKKGDPD